MLCKCKKSKNPVNAHEIEDDNLKISLDMENTDLFIYSAF